MNITDRIYAIRDYEGLGFWQRRSLKRKRSQQAASLKSQRNKINNAGGSLEHKAALKDNAVRNAHVSVDHYKDKKYMAGARYRDRQSNNNSNAGLLLAGGLAGAAGYYAYKKYKEKKAAAEKERQESNRKINK